MCVCVCSSGLSLLCRIGTCEVHLFCAKYYVRISVFTNRLETNCRVALRSLRVRVGCRQHCSRALRTDTQRVIDLRAKITRVRDRTVERRNLNAIRPRIGGVYYFWTPLYSVAAAAAPVVCGQFSTRLDFGGGAGNSLPLPFRPHLSSFSSLPPPLGSRSPLVSLSIVVRGVGECTSLEPGRQAYLGIDLHPFGCLITHNFMCLLPVKRKFS